MVNPYKFGITTLSFPIIYSQIPKVSVTAEVSTNNATNTANCFLRELSLCCFFEVTSNSIQLQNYGTRHIISIGY